MLTKLIEFFSNRLLLVNFIFISVMAAGVYYWKVSNTEDLPNIDFDYVRVSVVYSGASAEDVEYFVTRPIEDALRGVSGIFSVRSTSSFGSSSIFVEMERNAYDKREIVENIKSAVSSVNLPDEVRDVPNVRQFKTSERSIIDIALIDKNSRILDFASRSRLQSVSLALENQLLAIPVVSSISRSGYLKKQIRINLLPEKLAEYDLSISTVSAKLDSYDLKQPLGKLEDEVESEIVVADTSYEISELGNLLIRGNYQTPNVRLEDIAYIEDSFEKTKTVSKVNGYEAVILRVTKSSSIGILKAIDQIKAQVKSFEQGENQIVPVLLDDESIPINNRISLITGNGTIGFVLILVLLFALLDFNSGFWVAMGIPFCFAFTMIVIYMLGYTINNVTLAGIIIVMGMLVDDAIVVAENIVRLRRQGVSYYEAVVYGTREMFLPVTAAVITTCIAFIPIFLMDGRYAVLVVYIPVVVIIMLGASLFESLFLLPAHMSHDVTKSWGVRMLRHLGQLFLRVFSMASFNLIKPKAKAKANTRVFDSSVGESKGESKNHNWFNLVEDTYAKLITKVLRLRILVIIFFIAMILGTGYYFNKYMKFLMFPGSDITVLFISGEAPPGTLKYQTDKLLEQIERVVQKNLESGDVINYRTDVGRMRRGQAAEENSYFMWVEFAPKEQLTQTVDEVIADWNKKLVDITNITYRINKPTFGSADGGTPIELVVLDNNEEERKQVIKIVKAVMENDPALFSVEEDPDNVSEGFAVTLNRNLSGVTGVDERKILSSLRTVLNGTVIKEIPANDEKIDLVLTVPSIYKSNVNQLVNIPIDIGANTFRIDKFVEFRTNEVLKSISRERYRRISKLYADNRSTELIDKTTPKNNATNDNVSKSSSGTDVNSVVKNNQMENVQSVKFENADKRTDIAYIKAFIGEEVVNNTLAGGIEGQTTLQIAERYEQFLFPALRTKFPNSIVYFDGEVKESRESQSSFRLALVGVIFLIYMVLALLFNSLTKPLIIMSVLPFVMVGVTLAFLTHGIDVYGFFALMGFLGLLGVVVNDNIVMMMRMSEITFSDNLSFREIADKISATAKTRLRAVLMTTLTTVAGLFPTVYGVLGYDPMLSEMMFVMAWGLTFATLITLFLVPILYSYYISIKIFINKKKAIKKSQST